MTGNSNHSRIPWQAWLLAAFLGGVALFALRLFGQREIWAPASASVHGAAIDFELNLILAITGFMFVLIHGALGFLIWRHSRRRPRDQYSVQSRRFELRFAAVAACLILVVDVALFALGEGRYRRFRGLAPAESLVVEVTGEQFAWNFRYPGGDGVFGRSDPGLIDLDANPLGLDFDDPASGDDVVTLNEMHLPVGRTVRLRLRSKDVLHSFSAPALRVKQDALPGAIVEVWFTPSAAGEFEIACNQLCGLGHYRMRAFLTVESNALFEAWLAERALEAALP